MSSDAKSFNYLRLGIVYSTGDEHRIERNNGHFRRYFEMSLRLNEFIFVAQTRLEHTSEQKTTNSVANDAAFM